MGKITSAATMLLLFFFVAQSYGAEFYASKTSNKYHRPRCKQAKKIKPARLIKFNSPEEAGRAGYVPCKYCRPPLSSELKTETIEDKKEVNDKEWLRKGNMLSDSGNYSGAVNAFSKGIEINPGDARTYYNRGLAYAKTDKQKQAIEDFNKAIDLNPRYTMAYTNRGAVYLGMKNYEKANEDFNSAIGLDPRHHWAYYNKACLYSLINEADESCRWLEKAIEEGYNDWGHIEKDTDLNNIRSTGCYKKLMSGR